MSEYNLNTVEAIRDEALRRVFDNAPEDWRIGAMKVVERLKGEKVTGEAIRLACEEKGIKPHHPNAWGAFIAWLKRSSVLKPTGVYVNMVGPKSNARKTEVYIVR
jgi:hypothetical protein